MRVLVGTSNIGNAIPLMAQGFRDLGLQVTTASFVGHSFYPDEKFDITLQRANIHVGGAESAEVDVPAGVHDIIHSHDMFVFIAGESLTGHFGDLPLLHQLGKKVVIFAMGSEVRHAAVAAPFYEKYGYEFPYSYYPPPAEKNLRAHPLALDQYVNTFANKVYTTRMAERYATAIFCDIPTYTTGVRPFHAGPFPFPPESCVFRIPGRAVPHVVHAPSARAIKRTDAIMESLAALRAEGIPFTFELLENRTNSEVLNALTQADMLIDQIGSPGSMGRLSLEGIASGCAVVGCNNSIVPYPGGCPIIRGTVAQLTDQLRILLQNQKLRIHLAAEGRAWMLRGQTSPRHIAARMLKACTGELPCDYYPTAFVDVAAPPQGEPLPRFLGAMTLALLHKYGCHPQSDVKKLEERGLIPPGSAKAVAAIPRWQQEDLHHLGPWAWCASSLAPAAPTNTLEYHLHLLSKENS